VNTKKADSIVKDVNIRATALQEFWSDEYDTSCYLWEGAKHTLPLSKIMDCDIPTLPDQFTTKEELLGGHDFCTSFYYRALPILAKKLNAIHHLNVPVLFWQTALGLWLYRHISVVYDKFVYLKNFDIDATGTKLLDRSDFYIPHNHYDYLLCFTRDFGVQQLVSHYYYLCKTKEFPVVRKSAAFPNDIWSIPQNNSSANPEAALLGAYFSPAVSQELQARSAGRIGNIVLPVVNGRSDETDPKKRTILAEYPDADAFEYFFFQTLYYCFPKDLLENFHAYYAAFERDIASKRFTHIVSEVWITNIPASIYVATAKENGRTFISYEHASGAYFYSNNLTSFMIHDVADVYLSVGWGLTKGNFVRGGFAIKDSIPYQFSPEKEQVLFIGRAKFLYWEEFNAYNAVNSTFIREMKMVQDFIDLLPKHINDRFMYRPRKEIFFWDTEMNLELKERNVALDTGEDFIGSISRSRIVVIDHISTSIAELLLMNVPFILLHDISLIPLPKELKPIFRELEIQGVVHRTATSAADHLRKYYDHVEEWWLNDGVQIPIKELIHLALAPASNVVNYLMSLLPENGRRRPLHNLPEHGGPYLKESTEALDSEVQLKNQLSEFIRDTNRVYINPGNKTKFNYSDGLDREDNVLKILRSVKDLSTFSEELHSSIHDWVTEYHFSRERHNLLRHIEFDPGWTILELGCGCGSMSRYFGESGATVTAIEGSYGRACSASERCRDLENVKIFCSNFQDVVLNEKYDLVTLIGVLEYSPLFFTSDDPIGECLTIAYNALKPEGVLIVAIENQLGLKYFSGYHEDHVDIPFYGIEDRYTKRTAVTYGKKELGKILNRVGFSAIDFQYPFPDYKIPKAVFSHKAFHNEAFRPAEIISQLKVRDYSGDITPPFDQALAIDVLCRNGMMEDLSNSFLVFASLKNELPARFLKKDWLATYYTTDRVKAYNVQTGFLAKNEQILVRKETICSGTATGAPNSILEHKLQVTQYADGKILENEYRRCVLSKDFERFSYLMSLQIKFIEHTAIQKVDHDNPALSEILPDFIDAIPSNLILRNDALFLIDKEWSVTKRVSVGALLMRTVDAIRDLPCSAPEISRENLLIALDQAGYKIDAGILNEYNILTQEIVAQVYTGAVFDHSLYAKHPYWIMLETVRNKLIERKKNSQGASIVFDRLCSHIDEMFAIYKGGGSAGYVEMLRTIGHAHELEVTTCRQLLGVMKDASDWHAVTDFIALLIGELQTELSSNKAS
jgi:putative transferase (TIGR04331 family)